MSTHYTTIERHYTYSRTQRPQSHSNRLFAWRGVGCCWLAVRAPDDDLRHTVTLTVQGVSG